MAEADALFAEVRAPLHAARDAAARQVHALLVLTDPEIGRRIVEHEQGGEARTEHGGGLLPSPPAPLTEELGRRSSVAPLTRMRRFSLTCRDRPPKSETPSRNFAHPLLPAWILETPSTVSHGAHERVP
jgi:hypothetical protein